MSVDYSDPLIFQTYEKIRTASSDLNWMTIVFKPNSKDTLQVGKTGSGGHSELLENLGDEVAFLYFKFDDNSNVLVYYVPEKVSSVKRARALVFGRHISNFLKSYDAQITAVTANDLAPNLIKNRIAAAKSANSLNGNDQNENSNTSDHNINNNTMTTVKSSPSFSTSNTNSKKPSEDLNQKQVPQQQPNQKSQLESKTSTISIEPKIIHEIQNQNRDSIISETLSDIPTLNSPGGSNQINESSPISSTNNNNNNETSPTSSNINGSMNLLNEQLERERLQRQREDAIRRQKEKFEQEERERILLAAKQKEELERKERELIKNKTVNAIKAEITESKGGKGNLLECWITHQNFGSNLWKRRYCIANGTCINLYKDIRDSKPIKILDLRHAIIQDVDQEFIIPNAFCVTFRNKEEIHYFYSDDKKLMLTSMAAFEKCAEK